MLYLCICVFVFLYLFFWYMGISFLKSLNNPLFKDIPHVGSFRHFVIWCICVFACQNIVFEVLVLSHFQKYNTCRVILQNWPKLYLCICLFVYLYLCISSSKTKGWLAIATLKLTFTFLVGILPSKSIEYGKIPTKKSESWF